MGKLEDYLNDMAGDAKSSSSVHVAHLAALHKDYQNCSKVYRVNKGNPEHGELPITLAKVKDKDMYLISFGEAEIPFRLNKEELIYMLTGLTKGISEMIKDETGEDVGDLTKENLKNANTRPSIGIGSFNPGKTLEELQELMKQAKDAQSVLEDDEQIGTDNYEEAKRQAEDMKEIFDGLSEEEKEVLQKDIREKQEQMLYDRAKALEKDLMGSLQEEQPITYDYAYFKKVHAEQGTEMLREELAKIPREERQDIIDKIVEEAQAEANDELDQ